METGSDGRGRGEFRRAAANDNPGSRAGDGAGPEAPGKRRRQAGAGHGPETRVEAAVMRLARLLGRQIAREHFETGRAANDNAPEDEAGER